ncbi:GMC oxidoreductase-domain-containing protein [Xylaria digitata]|nr:GMC oxidoreductase-domain-containing protein [Xylaria digitata]
MLCPRNHPSRLQVLIYLLVAVEGASAALVPPHASAVSRQEVENNTYGFIVAGGGIAGLTVADRLTEDPSVSVLVIEAGSFDQREDNVLIPEAYPPFQYFSGLESVPQEGLNNRSIDTICAKVVGGGSVVNAMVYLRGDKADYDDWGKLGNPGWSWDSIFPYFLKGENFTKPDRDFAAQTNISWDNSVRGTSGPVKYSYPNYFYPGSANWWNAAKSIGLPVVKDPEAGNNLGIFWIPSVLDATTMTRSDARINHYERVKASRPNYHILASTTVSKVVFNGARAVGVEYLPSAGGSSAHVYATKEVILAAGGIHTPQVLQLSGIGPRALLNELGILIVQDLPGVGQNLQDQSTLTIQWNFTHNVNPNSGSLDSNATYNAEQRALYDTDRTGAYTIVRSLSTNIGQLSLQLITGNYSAIAAEARSRDPAASLPSDVDPTVLEGYKKQRELLIQQFEEHDAAVGTLHWGTSSSSLIYHLKPLSRGTVNINSTDPLASPVLDYRTATDPIDLAVYVALL